MTGKENHAMVLLPRRVLAALGLDADSLAAALTADAEVDVRVVEKLDAGLAQELPKDRWLILAGAARPLDALGSPDRQVPVDLAAWLPWMRGLRDQNALSLVRGAVEAAGHGPAEPPAGRPADRRVLVYGRSGTARRLVSRLKEAAREVVWIGPDGGEDEEGYQGGRNLVAVDGFAGRFEVQTVDGRGREVIRAGAVAVCGDARRVAAMDETGPAGIDLADLEDRLAAGPPDWADRKGFKVVFTGLGPAASTGVMGRVLGAAVRTAETTAAQVFVLTPHVKVAEQGFERLYGRARRAGVAVIRWGQGDGPRFEGPGLERLRVHDPAAGADLAMTPDLVVRADRLVPDDDLTARLGDARVAVGTDGFAGPDNALFAAGRTNRRGIYVLGPARGTDAPGWEDAEIDRVIGDVADWLDAERVPPLQVVFDEDRCAHCLTCVRACPMGAIEFTSRPWPDPWSCVSCGVCVAVCPAHALTLSGVDQERMRRRNRILLDRPRSTGDFAPRLLLFGCQRSAVTALSAGPRPNAAMDLAVSPLPCGGKLEDRLVLSALLDGADGVLVSVCHDDNCRTQEGNREAARRYARLIELLGVLGVDPGRVGWVSAAPNQGPDLADKIQAFSEHIQTLGPLETGRRS